MTIAAAAALTAGCVAAGPQSVVTPATGALSFAAHARPVPQLSDGDAVAGRTAFLDLHCHACHRVAEDPALPAVDGAEGPLLHDLGEESPESVGWKIVSRTDLDPDAIYDSPMTEAASAMTEQQLVDVIAYLRDPAAGAKGRGQ